MSVLWGLGKLRDKLREIIFDTEIMLLNFYCWHIVMAKYLSINEHATEYLYFL